MAASTPVVDPSQAGRSRDSARSPAWLKHVACITTSRADSGLYAPLLDALATTSPWQITCLAGGTHPSEEYGRTMDTLARRDRVRLVAVEHHGGGDTPADVARSAGNAVAAFGNALSACRPDLVFVLGDRTEMLGAALAALVHNLPIAHLHGGDATLGAYDDACRHAITKLSHLHFPAHPEHARRIAALGEETWRISCCGALALDALARFAPLSRAELAAATGLALREGRPLVVLVYHPETLSPTPADEQIRIVLDGVRELDADFLCIGPNADVGRAAVAEALTRFVAQRPHAVLAASLAPRLFHSALAHADVLVGNSSAGIIEAASLGTAVVNIGDRQTGRIRPANVIDAPTRSESIRSALAQAIAPAFKARLESLTNPYGDGHAAERVVGFLRELPDRETVLFKRG